MFNGIPYNTSVERLCGFSNQSAIHKPRLQLHLAPPFLGFTNWSVCSPLQISYLFSTRPLALGGWPEWWWQWIPIPLPPVSSANGEPIGVQRESSPGIHSPASFWADGVASLGQMGFLVTKQLLCNLLHFPLFWVVTALLLLALDSGTVPPHSSVICLSVNKPPLIIIIWMSSLFCWDPNTLISSRNGPKETAQAGGSGCHGLTSPSTTPVDSWGFP